MTRLPIAIAAGLLLLLTMAAPASAEEVRLTAQLSGANEVGEAGGDTDGSGQANLSIDTVTGEVCFDVTTSAIEAPQAAHIHNAGAGANGGVVVNLDWANTNGSGCVTAPAPTLVSIASVPSLYYVNVHTSDFPAGAIRGQLALAPADAAPVTGGPAELAFTGSGLTAILAAAGATMVVGGSMLTRTAQRREQ